MTTDSLLRFSGSFNLPLFSPLIPPSVRHFTMEPTHRSISFSLRFSYRFLTGGTYLKGRKIICWVAWRHPGFAINRVLPSKTPRNTAKSKDYWVAQKFDHLNSSVSAKSTTFNKMTLTSDLLAHMLRCDRPCCPFPTRLGKMYHEPSKSARWPDVKQGPFHNLLRPFVKPMTKYSLSKSSR